MEGKGGGMKRVVKKTVKAAMRARTRARWKSPRVSPLLLTASERAEIDALWGRVWSKPSYGWHAHFKQTNGLFDPRYLPIDVFYLDILPKMSNLDLALAWEDKSYYQIRFPDAPFPRMIAACVNGVLCDGKLTPSDYAKVWQEVIRRGAVFVKPSIGSYQGLGAFRLTSSEANCPEELARVLSRAGNNYVVQELISQHEVLSSFNPDSVKIIRINTLNLTGEPVLANATIRFGMPGRVTDMTYIDGVETVRVVGVTEDGIVRDFMCDQDGRRMSLHKIGVNIGGTKLPGFERACEICMSLHRALFHFGLVAFDVAIGRSGEPIVVEMNLGGPGAVFYQYANGPFFGDMTKEVISWCESKRVRTCPLF